MRRNTALLPAYTFLLGLIALLGYMAIARGIDPSDPNFAVPDLFLNVFPSWFVGFAFAAIAIGALVPAAVMSIAAANLFTRSVYKAYLRPDASHGDEARTAKIVSLLVKVGALVIIVALPTKYAIELQLLGGVWILQTLPSIVIGLYTRWLHRWALVAGWAVGHDARHAHGRVAGLRADVSARALRDDDQRLHRRLRARREPRRDAVADARPAPRRRRGRRRRDDAPRTSTSSPRTPSTRRPAHPRPWRKAPLQRMRVLAALIAPPARCRQARTR